ncbi:MAG TPA: tagatose 1,6-diphosphate aldolase [Acidimicrobiia bacterium]|nr:tagatose 1,6-diphosphate aldolase [Acidimicrobiia bacterium]
MALLAPGKVRALTQASNDAGVFTIFAIDHRDAMRAILDPDDPQAVPASTLTDLKLAFVRAMSPHASAVLVDPEYSAIQAVRDQAIGRDTAFLVALEAQGYLGDPHERLTSLLDGWSVERAKRLGASGVKLLLPYRPDSEAADAQDALVSEVVAECARYEIPLFLEPIGYRIEGESPQRERRWIVCESVRRLGALGPDILKVPFPEDTSRVDLPAWRDACVELNEACPVPWALLSGGDELDSFATQVEVACHAGSSGFLVGRALWASVIVGDPQTRRTAINDHVVPGFTRLARIATSLGRSWIDRVGPEGLDPVPFGTY